MVLGTWFHDSSNYGPSWKESIVEPAIQVATRQSYRNHSASKIPQHDGPSGGWAFGMYKMFTTPTALSPKTHPFTRHREPYHEPYIIRPC